MGDFVKIGDVAEGLQERFASMAALCDTPEHKARVEQNNKLMQDKTQQDRVEQSGIGSKFFNVSFSTYKAETDKQKRAVEVMKLFASDPGRKMLIICGSVGVGKTHLVGSLIREVNVQSVMYVDMRDMVVKLRSSYSFKAEETEEQIRNRIYSTPLLILDELGKGKDQKIEQDFVNGAIAKRYDTKKPIVVITNMNTEDMQNYFFDDVKDRIKEVGKMLHIDGESYRKELSKEVWE